MMQLGPFTVECSRFPHIPVPVWPKPRTLYTGPPLPEKSI